MAQFEKIKMTSDDLPGVIEALIELKKEIDGYPPAVVYPIGNRLFTFIMPPAKNV